MIEVGEYIRTRKGITKIKKTSKKCSLCENSLIVNNETHKHSKNIIDLIEMGDYVNGGQVYKGHTANGEEKMLVCFDHVHGMALDVVNIKTILTHELYEQNCYKVGDIE